MKYSIGLVGFGCFLLLASYVLTFGLYARIIKKRRNKKEMVYYLSKITTIKNIVKANHQSKIFNDFNEEGNLEGININYNRLLELITDNDTCQKGYRKCGILDTIGNILCIDELFDCPINQINVDLKAERNKYINNGSKEIYNENLIYNYQFYYSNKSINNNIIVSILFSQNKPNYITISNFAIDTEAYEDLLGALPETNEDSDEKQNFDQNVQDVIIAVVSEGNSLAENALKVVFSLLSFTSNQYMPNERMEEFKKYAEEKIKEEENKTDKYYIHIGENSYIKNYIGFQSLEDTETFMNFDYKKIYKKIFPSKSVIIVSIIFLVLVILFFFAQLIFAGIFIQYLEKKESNKEKKFNDDSKIAITNGKNDENNKSIMENNQSNNNIQVEEKKNNADNNKQKEKNLKENSNNNTENNNKVDTNINTGNIKYAIVECLLANITFLIVIQIIMSVLFLLINLWILLAAVKRYSNLNKKFFDLRQVKSDEFITRFINEFIEICSKKTALYYASIIVPSIAMFFHLVGFILIIIPFI